MKNYKLEGSKILIINPFGIGDVLFSTPLIRILKEGFPRSSLYYICNKRAYDVIEKSPQLDGVFIFEKGDYKELWKKNKLLCLKEFISFVGRIKKERFDLAIDISMGHRYSFFLRLLNVPERIGFDYRGRGRFLTKRLTLEGFDDKPVGEYYKDLLKLIGLDAGMKYQTKICVTDEDRDYIDKFFKKEGLGEDATIIALAPGGGISWGADNLAFRRWPKDNFAKLAEALIKDMDAKVVLVEGPGEEALIKDILDLMEVRPIVLPKVSVRELAVLMSRCACVVCNDGGPLHIAVAAGARTVSIFGPVDENVYGPYPKDRRHLTISKEIECRPCYKRFRLPSCKTGECLKGLDFREVYESVKEHINNGKA